MLYGALFRAAVRARSAKRAEHLRIVQARAPDEILLVARAAEELLLGEVLESVEVAALLVRPDRRLQAVGSRRSAVVPVHAEPSPGHLQAVVHRAAPGEAAVHCELAQPSLPKWGKKVARLLEGEQPLVFAAAALLLDHAHRLGPELVDDASALHQRRREERALSQKIIQAAEEGLFAWRPLLLRVNQTPEIVAHLDAHLQAAKIPGCPGHDADRVAVVIDGGVGLEARDRGSLRRREDGRAEVQGGPGRRIAHDDVGDLAASRPALGRPDPVRGNDHPRFPGRQALAFPVGDQPGPELASAGDLDLHLPRMVAAQAEVQARRPLAREARRLQGEAALPPGGPEQAPDQQRVLVLPVVPVDSRLDGIDALGQEALLHVGEGHHPSPARTFRQRAEDVHRPG